MSLWGAAVAALIVAADAGSVAGSASAHPGGVWLSEAGMSHVRISPCDGSRQTLCGEIVWLRTPIGKDGKPWRDIHNEDESLRNRPILGLRVLRNLEHQGGGEWDDGEIYNPLDGETYDAELKMVDANTLEVSGCRLVFCKTQTWTRIE